MNRRDFVAKSATSFLTVVAGGLIGQYNNYAQIGPRIEPNPNILPVESQLGGFQAAVFKHWEANRLVYLYVSFPEGNPLGNCYETNLLERFRAAGLIWPEDAWQSFRYVEEAHFSQPDPEPIIRIVKIGELPIRGNYWIGVDYQLPLGVNINAAKVLLPARSQAFLTLAPGTYGQVVGRSEGGSHLERLESARP